MTEMLPFPKACALRQKHYPTPEKQLQWTLTPHPQLDGRRPIDVLASGQEEQVLAVLKKPQEHL